LGKNVEVFVFQFKEKKNIQFSYLTVFIGDGEFHAVLSSQWTKEMEADPMFASGVGTSTFDMEADAKLQSQFKAGTFKLN
jgi:hypothetical protein